MPSYGMQSSLLYKPVSDIPPDTILEYVKPANQELIPLTDRAAQALGNTAVEGTPQSALGGLITDAELATARQAVNTAGMGIADLIADTTVAGIAAVASPEAIAVGLSLGAISLYDFLKNEGTIKASPDPMQLSVANQALYFTNEPQDSAEAVNLAPATDSQNDYLNQLNSISKNTDLIDRMADAYIDAMIANMNRNLHKNPATSSLYVPSRQASSHPSSDGTPSPIQQYKEQLKQKFKTNLDTSIQTQIGNAIDLAKPPLTVNPTPPTIDDPNPPPVPGSPEKPVPIDLDKVTPAQKPSELDQQKQISGGDDCQCTNLGNIADSLKSIADKPSSGGGGGGFDFDYDKLCRILMRFFQDRESKDKSSTTDFYLLPNETKQQALSYSSVCERTKFNFVFKDDYNFDDGSY